jgi:7-cyano-7-deazaguanine synthase
MLLDSGGLDSTVLKYHLHTEGFNVHSVLVNYGQKHAKELEFAKLHCGRLSIQFTELTIPKLLGSTLTGGNGSVVVPNRNAILLALAVNIAVAAQTPEIAYACNREDEANFPDCRWGFVCAFNSAIEAAGLTCRVVVPFINKSKAWIAALGRDLGVELNSTWSCYAGGENPCGQCEACRKREAALKCA